MRHSSVDKRSKRYAAKQCVSDYGMHRDANTHKERYSHERKLLYSNSDSANNRAWPPRPSDHHGEE